ncbi:Scr1 family TA system antitoxin-like transcriptional regulator [Streptomyces sp. NPDC021354]|uniref:Scr1 family TA system antitoxin-like transcriptional regulator n=1 Tax=Streptomyces sp. NPDC021354 TaxID=3154793 RepID=UPI0033F13086
MIHDVQPNATVARLLLGGQLEQLREMRGLTLKQVAGTLYVSVSKLSRIERGRHRAVVEEVARLADFYEARGQDLEQLMEWARTAQGRGDYHSFTDVADAAARDYLDVEAVGLSAVYTPQVFPAVLRTQHYAAVLLGPMNPEEVARRLWLLGLRQRRFFQIRRAPVRVLLSEAALTSRVGGPEVMAEQRQRLLHAPVQVRVLPAHCAARSPAAAGFAVAVLGGGRLTLAARNRDDGRLWLDPDRKGRAAAQFGELWQAAADLRTYC